MRRGIYNGLISGQTVDAYIKEAAHRQTQKGKQEYQKYFHESSLWLLGEPVVNTLLVNDVVRGFVGFPQKSQIFAGDFSLVR